ncbi:uncharacterized protein LOC106666517 isoform X2 [Cimex lectularius]|uniref:non-specific serine/threonine protein kinase n=1 Tax=Cimex lectularius TaxID=79782 RepID=A0A8I6RMH3_CIMLE|nr:uncharacterized protein LOC106666517 isoform X2 [Cimex lectularius]
MWLWPDSDVQYVQYKSPNPKFFRKGNGKSDRKCSNVKTPSISSILCFSSDDSFDPVLCAIKKKKKRKLLNGKLKPCGKNKKKTELDKKIRCVLDNYSSPKPSPCSSKHCFAASTPQMSAKPEFNSKTPCSPINVLTNEISVPVLNLMQKFNLLTVSPTNSYIKEKTVADENNDSVVDINCKFNEKCDSSLEKCKNSTDKVVDEVSLPNAKEDDVSSQDNFNSCVGDIEITKDQNERGNRIHDDLLKTRSKENSVFSSVQENSQNSEQGNDFYGFSSFVIKCSQNQVNQNYLCLSSGKEKKQQFSSALSSNSNNENIFAKSLSPERVSQLAETINEKSIEMFSERSTCLNSFEQSLVTPGSRDLELKTPGQKSFMKELSEDGTSSFTSLFDKESSQNLDNTPSIKLTTAQSKRNLSLEFSICDRTSNLEPLPENQEDADESGKNDTQISCDNNIDNDSYDCTPLIYRMKSISPTRRRNILRPAIIPELNNVIEESDEFSTSELNDEPLPLEHFVIPPGKKYRRSISIIRHLEGDMTLNIPKGRNYENSVEKLIKLQKIGDKTMISTPTNIIKKKLSLRSSLLRQFTPTRRKRSISFQLSSPTRSPIMRNTSLSFLKNSLPDIKSPLLNSPSEMLCVPNIDEKVKRSSNVFSSLQTYSQSSDYAEIVFFLCNQTKPCDFSEIYPQEIFKNSIKVGEGVFGEVFLIMKEKQKSVLKIIPIEGDFPVNGEKQKTYSEIYSELLITHLLNGLRGDTEQFMTKGFVELISAKIVQGRYPEELIRLWEEFDVKTGSDNDNPTIFGDNQLYLTLELAHGGTDLESYSFSTAKQALSIFKQTAFSLAVAEACCEFEHRDLHWGNILISGTIEREMKYLIGNKEFKVTTNGVKATIIDFTLSRVLYKEDIPIYCDIGKDPEMFIATGDYQFDIYRHMKKDLNNEWDIFEPKTNVRWLHYVLDKMIKEVKYKRKSAKVHKDSMTILDKIETWILDCDNCFDIVLRLTENR